MGNCVEEFLNPKQGLLEKIVYKRHPSDDPDERLARMVLRRNLSGKTILELGKIWDEEQDRE